MHDFEESIINNWADRFQCPASTIKQSGTTLLPDEKYADQNMIILWLIGRHTFANFSPARAELLKDVMVRLPGNTSLSGDHIQQVLGADSIVSRDIGLIHYLSPVDLPDLTTSAPFHVRELALSDQEHLSALHGSCTPEEVDEAFVEIDHEIVFGCFNDHELVSAASGYRMTGFLDIGILTHSRFRKSGLGKMVVGALCSWAIAHKVPAQYRCNILNSGSLGVARSLNFRHYFGSESIILKP